MAERAPADCLIDGQHVRAADSGRPVIDPYTEQAIGSTPEAGPDLVDRAVRSAAAAQQEWARAAIDDRAALLERVADLIESEEEQLAGLVSEEMGMPIGLARVTQAQLPASVLRATAEVARTGFDWQQVIDGAELRRSPAGVVGAITPWNMPVHQIIAKAAAAVVAGCSIVLKPAEQTPYDALRIGELFLEAGAPAGLFSVVTGTGPVTGAALAAHPALDRLSFTGSVRGGRAVAAAAAQTLTRTSLELGGKSPAVVLPDADFERAIPAVLGSGLVNSGQACNATTRLLIAHHQAAEAEELLADAARNVVLGDPRDPATTHGPLVSRAQREAVLGHIAGARAQGGRLITGTGAASTASPTGWFVDPTVIVGLPEDAHAVREEIFGPVIVVQTYTDVDDAVRIANDSDYGLSAEVWSDDPAQARAVAARLRVGQVKINGVRTRTRPLVPFGGMRDSGYGRELGAHGIEEFTEITAVMA